MPWKQIRTLAIFCSVITLIILVSASGITSAVEEPIYIGVLLPLSGPEGQPLHDALELGVQQLNAGGGIRTDDPWN